MNLRDEIIKQVNDYYTFRYSVAFRMCENSFKKDYEAITDAKLKEVLEFIKQKLV